MVAGSQHSKRNSAPHYGFGDGFSHGVPGEVFSRNRSNKEEDAMKNNKLCLVAGFVLTCGTIHAGNVVTDWNAIASTTVVTNGAKSPGVLTFYFYPPRLSNLSTCFQPKEAASKRRRQQ